MVLIGLCAPTDFFFFNLFFGGEKGRKGNFSAIVRSKSLAGASAERCWCPRSVLTAHLPRRVLQGPSEAVASLQARAE